MHSCAPTSPIFQQITHPARILPGLEFLMYQFVASVVGAMALLSRPYDPLVKSSEAVLRAASTCSRPVVTTHDVDKFATSLELSAMTTSNGTRVRFSGWQSDFARWLDKRHCPASLALSTTIRTSLLAFIATTNGCSIAIAENALLLKKRC